MSLLMQLMASSNDVNSWLVELDNGSTGVFQTNVQARDGKVHWMAEDLTNDDQQVGQLTYTGKEIWTVKVEMPGTDTIAEGQYVCAQSNGDTVVSIPHLNTHWYQYLLSLDAVDGSLNWGRIVGTGASSNYLVRASTHNDSSDNLFVAYRNWIGSTQRGYIAKFNSSGTAQWNSDSVVDSSQVRLQGVSAGASGNVYAVGYILDSYDNCYIAKWNSSGTLQWQRELSKASTEIIGSGVFTDSSENVYVAMRLGSDWCIAKYNSSGTIQWQRELDVNITEDVHISGNDDYIVAAGGNGAVACWNTSGTHQWTRRLTGDGVNRTAAQVDPSSLSIPADNPNYFYMGAEVDGYGIIAKLPMDGAVGFYGFYEFESLSPTERAGTTTDAASGCTSIGFTPSETSTTPTVSASSYTLTKSDRTDS